MSDPKNKHEPNNLEKSLKAARLMFVLVSPIFVAAQAIYAPIDWIMKQVRGKTNDAE